jgi:hypothetical protein
LTLPGIIFRPKTPCRWRGNRAGISELRGVLKQLGGILTVDGMRKLNYAVDGKQQAGRGARVLDAKGLVR